MESPEYEALNQCSTTLFSCIQQSPSDIVDKLKPPGLLAPGVLSFLGNPIHDDSEKARKIIDVMIKQVEIDSQVFHIFVKALKAAGPWTKGAVTKLENKHKTLLSSTSQAEQPKDPGEGEQLSLGGSDSTTQVQAAPISDTPLPQSGPPADTRTRHSGATNTSVQSQLAVDAQSEDDDEYFSCEEDSNVSSVTEQAEHIDTKNTADPTTSISVSLQDTLTTPSQLGEHQSTAQEPLASELSDESQSSESSSVANTQSGENSLANSQQLSNLPVECGCGQCTMYSYVSGKICPKPKQSPFPKFAVPEISEEEIEYIEEEFSHQSELLHDRFCRLVIDTFNRIEERSIEVADVLHYLKLRFKPKWYLLLEISIDKISDNFENISTFHQLSEHLLDKKYCSCFDYDLIEHIRDYYLFSVVTEEDQVLSDYKKYFKCYVNRRCFMYQHDTSACPSNQVEVKCKLDCEYHKVCQELIKHLKYIFAKTVGVPPYHLAFKTAKEGCTELTFRAPIYFGEIQKLSKYQIFQLQNHGFLKVNICGRILLQTHKGIESGEVSVEEVDINTTDDELIEEETHVDVSYHETLDVICKLEINFLEELALNVSSSSLWTVSHDGKLCIALLYSGKIDNKLQYSDYVNKMLEEKRNVMKASCVHLDENIDNPILIFEHAQMLKDYFTSCEPLTEIRQLTILRDVAKAVGAFGLLSRGKLKVTVDTIFIEEASDGEITALFSPIYQHSYFPQAKQSPESQTDYEWVKHALLLMHYRDKYNEHSELPESHILSNIIKYKWFSNEESLHPNGIIEIAKEIKDILELEETHMELTKALTSSNVSEVSHLHMILIGHSGVGKTSLRKHLQNIPFNQKEESTIIMEQELLCRVTMEASINTNSPIFEKSEGVYKGETGTVFLTLWDTGGQPMFQDLLPCFAKLRSIYGIVFRLCDLLGNLKAIVRPVCPLLENAVKSPYTCIDHIYRCLAFLDSFSSILHHNFSNLPPEVRTSSFESTELETFPRVALIGTFKDTVREVQLLEKFTQLKENLESFWFNLSARALLPVSSKSVVFEIDNTRSGQKYEDPGMADLREQIVTCTQSNKAKIPNAWISFKVDLEHESRIQQPFTGIVTLEKASEIARRHKVDPAPALCYFHELGIFHWYHKKDALKEYVIIEPKCLVSILGTVLNPEVFVKSPNRWQQLQIKGIISVEEIRKLFANSKTGLPWRWILSFFEEHQLAIKLNKEYFFIPSMLQEHSVCQNHLHMYDSAESSCKPLPHHGSMQVSPLFLVPKSKYIPPGFFPRLMTVLAGIQDGEIVWKLPYDSEFQSYKNVVSFTINDQASIVFTEFITCIRIQLKPYPATTRYILRKLCQGILSQLKVQLQRVFPQAVGSLVTATFACFCSGEPHFLPAIPSTTEDKISCSECPDIDFILSQEHKIWLQRSVPVINSEEDVTKLFQAALQEGSISLQLTTILFVGMQTSHAKEILDNTDGQVKYSSNTYINDGNNINILKPTQLDKFLACNTVLPIESEASKNLGDVISLDSKEQIEKRSDAKENPPSLITVDSKELADTKSSLGSDVGYHSVSNLKSKETTTDSNSALGKRKQIRKYKPHSQHSLESISRFDCVLKFINSECKELGKLEMIFTIECNEPKTIQLLPLLGKQVSVGIVDMQAVKKLKSIEHITQEWLTLQEESDIDHEVMTKTTIINEEELCEKIVSLSSVRELKTVPFAWCCLYRNIQKLFSEGKRMISRKEVLLLAKNIGVTQVSKQLSYMHDCGLLTYFEGFLPDVIFQNTSVLISILDSVHNAVQNNCAVISEDVFFQANDQDVYFDGLFTHREAVELFKHLLIISPFDDRFIMPSLLSHSVDETSFGFSTQKFRISPLLITGSLKPGMFGVLICYLTSKQNDILWPWEVRVHATNQREPTCLFKNRVQLILPGYDGIITLFESQGFIIVYVEFVDNQPPFARIRQAVISGLEKVFQLYQLREKFELSIGFECSCGSVDSTHIMVYNKHSKTLQCPYNPSGGPVALSHTQWKWFEEGVAESDKDVLSVTNVFQFLLPKCNEWYQVGLDLGLSTRVLQDIFGRHRDKPDVALIETVKYWFSNNPNPTWDSVRKDAVLAGELTVEEISIPNIPEPADTAIPPAGVPAADIEAPTTVALEMLMKHRDVSSDQLDCEIEEEDVTYLAGHFDNVELYLRVFGLTAAEQANVRRMAQDNQIAMTECLSLWRRHNPSTATLRTLLEILLSLRKEEIASNICSYYYPKHK